MAQEAREAICAGLRSFVSKLPPIGRKRATKGNETGNEQGTKLGFLCKTGNGPKMNNGNEDPLKNALFVSSFRELRKTPLTHLREVSSRRFWSLCASVFLTRTAVEARRESVKVPLR
jgi:hypothetical protein